MDEAQFLIDRFAAVNAETVAKTGIYVRQFGLLKTFGVVSNEWNTIWAHKEHPEPHGFEAHRLAGLHLILRLIDEGKQFRPWTIECHMPQRSMLWFREEDDAVLARLMVNG